MSSLEYKRFIGDAGCNDAMPAFSSTTWAPFKSVTAQEGVGDTLRAIDDYAPSFVDLAGCLLYLFEFAVKTVGGGPTASHFLSTAKKSHQKMP